MAKKSNNGIMYDRMLFGLQAIVPEASVSDYGALILKNAKIDDNCVKIIDEILLSNAKFFTSASIVRVESKRPISMSWITKATRLATINIGEKTQVSDLLESIITNDNLVDANFQYSEFDSLALRSKVDNALKIRKAKCIELGGVDPKLGQLGFNDFTHTWLPYDAASGKWKISELIYDEYTQSFNLLAPLSPPSQDIHFSKIEMIKANYRASISAMKHELEHRKADLKVLTPERDALLESVEANPEDASVVDEFLRKSGLIGSHKKHIRSLEEKIPLCKIEVVTKLEAQKTLDQKWFEAFDKKDISAMKLALAQGGDLYARDEFGKTAQDVLLTQIEKIAVSTSEDLGALITLLTQIQDEQEGLLGKPKLASMFESSSSAAAAGSVDMPAIGLDDVDLYQADQS